MNEPILHIYGQEAFHDDVYIAGNREGMDLLCNAILRSMNGALSGAEVSVCDGEWYTITVRVYSNEDAEKLAVPYTEDFAKERREAAIWPWKKEGER